VKITDEKNEANPSKSHHRVSNLLRRQDFFSVIPLYPLNQTAPTRQFSFFAITPPKVINQIDQLCTDSSSNPGHAVNRYMKLTGKKLIFLYLNINVEPYSTAG
jgi:hypothetical protein